MELIKTLQKECFIAHKINTDTYHDRVLKYEERIAEIKHSQPILEARLARESFSYLRLIKKPFKRKGKKIVAKKSKVTSKKKTNGWNHKNNNNKSKNNKQKKVVKKISKSKIDKKVVNKSKKKLKKKS